MEKHEEKTNKLEEIKELFTSYLEQNKFRKTPERFAILEEVYSTPGHFDAETLFIKMKNKNHRVSRATVYNTLEILVDCDLITRHQFGENQARYERSYGYKQHDHLICADCNKVFEFCDPRIQNIQELIEQHFGFEIRDHSLNFYGKCNSDNCKEKESA